MQEEKNEKKKINEVPANSSLSLFVSLALSNSHCYPGKIKCLLSRASINACMSLFSCKRAYGITKEVFPCCSTFNILFSRMRLAARLTLWVTFVEVSLENKNVVVIWRHIAVQQCLC